MKALLKLLNEIDFSASQGCLYNPNFGPFVYMLYNTALNYMSTSSFLT